MKDLQEILARNPALAKRNPGLCNPEKPKKASSKGKYHSTKTWAMGICFDSAYEAHEVAILEMLLKAKEIKGYCMQPRFMLTEGTGSDSRAETYVADVVVFLNDGSYEIIDYKGFETKVFKLKQKRFKQRFDLELKVKKREDER